VRSAVLPVVLLTVMTYVVMPSVTPGLRGWLYQGRTRRDAPEPQY
jgi:antibiotic biosynthesis monooxygenase (ABM) superfamily enzyme